MANVPRDPEKMRRQKARTASHRRALKLKNAPRAAKPCPCDHPIPVEDLDGDWSCLKCGRATNG